MSNGEKRMILILILITIVVIIVGIVMSINKEKNRKEENKVTIGEENRVVGEENEVVEEFVQVNEDGTKINVSSKLKETKTIDGIEIGNLQLTTKNNVSIILGTVTNNTDEVKGGYPIDLTILDKEGKKIVTIGASIQQLQPGQSAEFNTSATFDFANAYDFTITK